MADVLALVERIEQAVADAREQTRQAHAATKAARDAARDLRDAEASFRRTVAEAPVERVQELIMAVIDPQIEQVQVGISRGTAAAILSIRDEFGRLMAVLMPSDMREKIAVLEDRQRGLDQREADLDKAETLAAAKFRTVDLAAELGL